MYKKVLHEPEDNRLHALLKVLYAYACPLSSPKTIDTSESFTDDVDVANDEFAS